MSGAVKRQTPNYGFNIINYDFPRWHTYEWDNWTNLDNVLAVLSGGIVFKGAWQNNTAYLNGDRVIDNSNGVIYFCLVSHTSPLTGTFADSRAANPTYWKPAIDVPVFRGNWTSGVTYSPNDIVAYGYAYYFCITLHTSGVSFNPANWTLLFDYTAAMAGATLACNCRLEYDTATQIKLIPFNGNKIIINGANFTIPSGGIVGSNALIGGNNLVRFIYVYNNAGTLTLEAGGTDPVYDPTSGVFCKPNAVTPSLPDLTRTLVGMVRTNASGQFAFSDTQRWVLSYFNRRPLIQNLTLAATETTPTTGSGFLSTNLSSVYISWAGDGVTGELDTLVKMNSAGTGEICLTTTVAGEQKYGTNLISNTTYQKVFLRAYVKRFTQSGQGAFTVAYNVSGQSISFDGGAYGIQGGQKTVLTVLLNG